MAAGKKFNLTELLNQRYKETVTEVTASEIADTEQTQLEINVKETEAIDWEDIYNIIPDEGNFYQTEDVEDLKQSIELMGLLQPLLVSETDQRGKRKLYAGHRRRKAILHLVEEGKTQFRQVPIMVRKKENDILDKLALIMANRFREKTGWEKMTEVVETERLVKELKRDMNIQGRTRELLAEIIQASPAQVGRFKAIFNNLIPELMQAFKENRISVSIAVEACGMQSEYQQKAAKFLSQYEELTLLDIKGLKVQEEATKQLPGQISMNDYLERENVTESDTFLEEECNECDFYHNPDAEDYECHPETGKYSCISEDGAEDMPEEANVTELNTKLERENVTESDTFLVKQEMAYLEPEIVATIKRTGDTNIFTVNDEERCRTDCMGQMVVKVGNEIARMISLGYEVKIEFFAKQK